MEVVSKSNKLFYVLLWLCSLAALTMSILSFEKHKETENPEPETERTNINTAIFQPKVFGVTETGQLVAESFTDRPSDGTLRVVDPPLTHSYFSTRGGVTTTKSFSVNDLTAGKISCNTISSETLTVSSSLSSLSTNHLMSARDTLGQGEWIPSNSDGQINTSGVIGVTVTDALNTLAAELPERSALLPEKGDLLSRTATEIARLKSDVPGQFLKSDSTSDIGLSWDTPLGAGDIVGPTGATENSLPVFDGTNGKLIKESDVFISTDGQVIFDGSGPQGPSLQHGGALLFLDEGNNYHVGFKSPDATMGSDVMLTLPGADGAASDVLTTDGFGVLSWSTLPGGNVFNIGDTFVVGDLALFADAEGHLLVNAPLVSLADQGTLTIRGGSHQDGLVLGKDSTQPKSIMLLDTGNIKGVGFQAPSTIASDVVWTLPDQDGGANHVLTTDATDKLHWSAPTNNVGTVTSPDTWVPQGVAHYADASDTHALKDQGTINLSDQGLLKLHGGSSTTGLVLENLKTLVFCDDGGVVSNSVSFKAPTALESSVMWTLPAADGNDTDTLTIVDANGSLAWVSQSEENNIHLETVRQVQVPSVEHATVTSAILAGATGIQVVSNVSEVSSRNMTEWVWDQTSNSDNHTPLMSEDGQITLVSAAGEQVGITKQLMVGHSSTTVKTYYFSIDELPEGDDNEVCLGIYPKGSVGSTYSLAALSTHVPPTGSERLNLMAWGSSGVNYHPNNTALMGPERKFQQGDVFEITFDGAGNVLLDLVAGDKGEYASSYPIVVELPTEFYVMLCVLDASSKASSSKVSVFMQPTTFLPLKCQYNINVVKGVTWDMVDTHLHLANSAGLNVSGDGIVTSTGIEKGFMTVFEGLGRSKLVFDRVTLHRSTNSTLTRGTLTTHFKGCSMEMTVEDQLYDPWILMSRHTLIEGCQLFSNTFRNWWFGGSSGIIRNMVVNCSDPYSNLFVPTFIENPFDPATLFDNIVVNGGQLRVAVDRRIKMRNCTAGNDLTKGIFISYSHLAGSEDPIVRRLSFQNCALLSLGRMSVSPSVPDFSSVSVVDCHITVGPKTILGASGKKVYINVFNCVIDGTPRENGFAIESGPAMVMDNIFKIMPTFIGDAFVSYSQNFATQTNETGTGNNTNLYTGGSYGFRGPNRNIGPIIQ
jgi:hypothetical protein